ncbi:MAG TPA: rRNA pseudouridine synthase [Deltaproteobacteria bacterium]|nr:rRNA pseudouridine synthase [Deltaproteobacteria bacterium]
MSHPLGKLVAHRAGLSRRLAGRAIRRGRVRVDGQPLTDPRAVISDGAEISLDARPLPRPPDLVVWHKPTGIQCTVGDPHGRPSLSTEAAEPLQLGLHPVGRLDADTSGLLLFTRDGALTQHLLHPRRQLPRTYLASVDPPPDDALIERVAAGIETAAGVFTGRIELLGGSTLHITVREGKHRMVRRMMANAGHPVITLRRLSFGPFELGGLQPGAWRLPTDAERDWARDALQRADGGCGAHHGGAGGGQRR